MTRHYPCQRQNVYGHVTGHAAYAAYGVIAAVLGPGIPIVAWLIVTYSYRQDKLMMINEVGKHVAETDLGVEAPNHDDPWGLRQMPHALSRGSSGRGSGAFLLAVNPLSAHNASVAADSEVQIVAKQIAVRSLRRWDAFMGFRAGHDGLGNTLGVWRDRFEGVRFAVLLLAMRKLNNQLQSQHGADGSGESPYSLPPDKRQCVPTCMPILLCTPTQQSLVRSKNGRSAHAHYVMHAL